nr:MAG TPA_asm: STRUCTURAL MAINTENANCE OF CHROMOSOMES PROTEIN [Caudoviricetes sp.]
MSVKIMALEAENVKRIKAVALTPLPTGLTLVGGNNNQGKTSVLDALAWALGGDRFRPDAAVRDGALAPAHLKVTLSNGVVVERKGKNASLTVTDPTGRRSGQQLLNAFVEPLALDLPRFMDATDKEKADILLRIIGIGTELHARDLEIKALYDKRTFTGQLASQKKHFAEELLSYPDAPEQPVSASDLIRQQQDILARNGENQRKRAQLASLEEKAQLLAQRVQALTRDLEAAEHALRTAQDDLQDARKSAEQLQDESTAALEASVRDIEETNRKVRANLEKARAEDEAAQYTAEYDQLTEAIAQKRADRMALLNGADLPLPGLGVEDGTLTYNGKHWRDMSGSDQLRVAAAIVRRLNPDCGFVLLDKLEQMDMDTLRSFAAWLEAEGLQAIATRVSTGSECQIIIEDGMVKDVQTTQPPVTEKPQPKSWTKGAF